MDSAFDLGLGTATLANTWGLKLRYREHINEPYRIRVDFCADGEDDTFQASLLEKPISIRLRTASRSFYGVVAKIELRGSRPNGLRQYRMRVVPRFSLLENRETSRIFQGQSAVEIVTAVLNEHGVTFRLRLRGAYDTRAYCAQYRETDEAFVKRLLAEEGIFSYFDHPPDAAGDANTTSMGQTEVMVLSDTAAFYAPIDGDPGLSSTHDAGLLGLDGYAHRFTNARRARARGALISGYDHERPDVASLDVRASAAREEPMIEVEGGDPRERATDVTSVCAQDIARRTLYEHEGTFEERPASPTPALVRLEQARAKVSLSQGRSSCPRLLVGRRFTLHDHFAGPMNADYAIVGIEHRVRSTELAKDRLSYKNRFWCVPANVRARPPRPKRHVVQAMETATVTAPKDQDIFVDEQGRVRVKFHWDLREGLAEGSSCWLRVAQAWAGAGWGSQFIPRAGMEVLVAFLNGDVDRPVVVGCVSNATHRPAFALPENSTQSGIRTQSVPGPDGFNELLFDDRRGAEVISLRSQRDIVEKAINTHRIEAGRDLITTATGNRRATVGGDDLTVVGGRQDVRVRGDMRTVVEGGGGISFGGGSNTQVAGDEDKRVRGGQTLVVGDFQRTLIGVDQKEGHGLLTINGNYRVGARMDVAITAGKSLKLSCGESRIELLPGEIRLIAPKLTLQAAEGLSCVGAGNQLTMNGRLELKADEIAMFSKNGSLVMDDEAKIDAKQVKLNCDPNRPKPDRPSDAPVEKGIIIFKVDPHLEIKPGDRFTMLISMPTGEVVEHEADANHEVHIEGVKGDRYTLVDVRLNGTSVSKKASS